MIVAILSLDGRRLTHVEFAALPDDAQFEAVYAPDDAYPAGRVARFACVTLRGHIAPERSYSWLSTRALTAQEREAYHAQT